MPRIETWGNLPLGVRHHLIDRMRDRAISIADLNELRHWIDSNPEVPEGEWYRDFGSFKIEGNPSRERPFRRIQPGLRTLEIPPPVTMTGLVPDSRPAFT